MTDSATRGRPRDAGIHAAILTAARDLIAERGYAATTMQAIAARSGCGKDTVYRRWSGKPELIYEALYTTAESQPPPDTGTLAGDLTELIARLVAEFDHPLARATLPSLLADFATDPRLRERIHTGFLAPAYDAAGVVLTRARDRGQIRTDIPDRLVLDLLVGTIFFRLGLLGDPPDRLLAPSLATIVMDGIR